MALVNITIDGKQIAAQAGQTILEAAQNAGIDIPTLCHHPALAPIGACRICLVEVEKQRTLQPACTFQVSEGMVVHTESPQVVEVRKFVLELLFSERNHYCMYCQMSGDCELQALAYRYGLDSWLYPRPYTPLPVDATRKHFVMDHNRCILCRRCVRMCGERVGNHTLGIGARGAHSMIIADANVPFGQSSCISCGNCLQVCPTGALMDRRSAYRGLEKDLTRTPSTCVACSIGCGIELLTRDNQLIRIEGDWDAPVNRGLLCEMGRFTALSDTRRRAWTPMIKRDGRMWPATLEEALDVVAARLQDGPVAAVVSPRVTNEALQLFAQIFARPNAGTVSVGSLNPLPEWMIEPEGTLEDLNNADLFILVGADLTTDHQVAGFPVRCRVNNSGARLIIIGEQANGLDYLAFRKFKPDETSQAVDLAQRAEWPVVIYGAGAGDVLSELRKGLSGKAHFVGLTPGSNGRGVAAAGLNGPVRADGCKTVFALIADDQVDDSFLNQIAAAEFVIVQTAYEGALTERADVVLPSGIWAEKSGSLTNTEGRVLPLHAALQPPPGVKSDQEVLQALAARMNLALR